MSKVTRSLLAVAIALLAALSLAPTAAHATVVMKEYPCDFESGGLAPGWAGGASNGGTWAIDAAPAPVHSGGYSMRQAWVSGYGSSGSSLGMALPRDGLKYELEGWFYVDEGRSWGMFTTPFEFVFDDFVLGVEAECGPNGYLGVYGPTAAQQYTLWGRSLPMKTWHHVKVTYDRVADTDTLVFDGVELVKDRPIPSNGAVPSHAYAWTYGGWYPGNAVKQYVDDVVVRVWVDEEPATGSGSVTGAGWLERGGRKGRREKTHFQVNASTGGPRAAQGRVSASSNRGFAFRSDTCEPLVVAGTAARMTGTGTVNGEPGFAFLVAANDGGKRGADALRLKVWEQATGAVVFDSQPGADDAAAPTTVVHGSIIVRAR